MDVQLVRIPYDEKSVLRNMMELYQYDFSEYEQNDLNSHGLFDYKYLDHYWKEEGRHPFFINVDGKHAGFALVRDSTNTGDENELAEFFIMRKYRRSGVGRIAAHRVFSFIPGKWHVCQTATNPPSHKFWRKVINEYTNGRYEEIKVDGWDGPMQEFYSSMIDNNKPWYHGSPCELESIRAGSSITQFIDIARVFSHKPSCVSISHTGDYIDIKHTGQNSGFLYRIAEDIYPGDAYIHPQSTMGANEEWLITRELKVELIGLTQVVESEYMTEKEADDLQEEKAAN
ncbi:MAG: GNAT family N-acetyltransferase [Armatimonadota bacterium]